MTRNDEHLAASRSGETAPEGRGFFSGRSLPWCIAHRGFSERWPENTIPAFRAAADAGADMIELDVTFTADREIIVIHDDTIDRTTDGKGPVSDLPLSVIRSLDAGSWLGKEFSGTRVPTLAEVFSAMGSRLPVNVEIKVGSSAEATRSLAAATADLVRKRGLAQSVLFSSFSDDALAVVREALPDSCIGVLARKPESPDTALRRIGALGAASYHLKAQHLNPALVTRLHGKGIKALVWTSATDNTRPVMEHALLAYADGFFANDPELFQKVREKVFAGKLP
ncbi:MAG: glycerophosphodiester phosphodiesterase family protein [Thermodesulfobacteriota bacterium]